MDLVFCIYVRKCCLTDLDIDGNVTVVDLLYQQFYTGRGEEPTEGERDFMRRLFRSETYVKNEYRYYRMTRKGQMSDNGELGNWTAYLERHRKWIEKGFQFTRLAVQEPYGVMILQVAESLSLPPRASLSLSLKVVIAVVVVADVVTICTVQ